MSEVNQDSTTPDTQPAEQRTPLLTQAQIEAIAEVVAQRQPKQPEDPPEWASGLLSTTSKLAEDVSRLQENHVSEETTADSGATVATPESAGTSPAEQPRERVFTQDELGQHVSAARKAEREKFEARLAELEQKIATPAAPAPTPANKPKTNNSDEPPEYVSSILDQIKGLSEAVGALKQDTAASKFDQAFKASGLPASLRDFAEAAVKGSGTDDIAGYLRSLKVNAPATETKPAKADAATQAPEAKLPPVAETKPAGEKPAEATPEMPGGTPSDQKDFSGVIDPKTLSREDVNYLRSQGKLLEVVEKWRRHSPGGGMSLFPKKRMG